MMRFVIVCSLMLSMSAVVWAEGLQGEQIFPLQGKHVHGSSIVECPNGDLLACWYHGSGERRANDVVVQGVRLKKGQQKWSDVFLMADTPDFPDCNPVMFVDRQQQLWMFWVAVRANRWEHSLLKYRIAKDYQGDGAPKWSWQDVILMKPKDDFAEHVRKGLQELHPDSGLWSEYAPPYAQLVVEAAKDPIKQQDGWMTRIHPIQLSTGRILLPLYSDGFEISMVGISDDDGQTWKASQPIVGLGASQPTLVAKRDGTIVSYHRDNGAAPKRVASAVSKDQGESWSIARDTDIPNPGSSLEVIPLKDGRWAMIYNDTENGRHSLAVAISADEGTTWKWKRHIEQGQSGKAGFGYPSMIQAKDGRLHATYSYSSGGQSIKHVAFDTKWVEQGD